MDEYNEDWEREERLRHQNEFGASSVEYGLLVSGIAAAITLSVWTFGAQVATLFALPPWP